MYNIISGMLHVFYVIRVQYNFVQVLSYEGTKVLSYLLGLSKEVRECRTRAVAYWYLQ